MSKIIVKNTKTGEERPMTQKSFDYLSAKKRGFEFVRKDIEPGSIEEHMERLKAEKALRGTGNDVAKVAATKQSEINAADSADRNITEQQQKKAGRPKKQNV